MSFDEISLMQQKCRTSAIDFGEDERKRRIRDSLILCINHMNTLGYFSSAQHLAQEAAIGEDRFELCDNMTFFRVLVDFETAFESKYGYKPKICKPVPKGKKKIKYTQNNNNNYELPPSIQKVSPGVSSTSFNNAASVQSGISGIYNNLDEGVNKVSNVAKRVTKGSVDDKKQPKSARNEKNKPSLDEDMLAIDVKPIDAKQVVAPIEVKKSRKDNNQVPDEAPLPIPSDIALIKPVPPHLLADYGDLTNVIARDIFSSKTGVTWDDIVGLNVAKRILREAVVMPLKFPSIFEQKKLLRPWKGVLLHGPPGTGKTLLAKAVASEGTTFFNISASTIVSKWRGDSEKLIRVLFELARFHAPSTIFIDELDSIMSKRSSHDEHEASRRMKTELLTQMDGLVKSDALVFVLAASNFPFDLDPALLRRLEKRIFVPLPEYEARIDMFKMLLSPDIAEDDLEFESFAQRTEKYSGSDISLVCKEAAMEPLRRLMDDLKEKYGDKYLDDAKQGDVILELITNNDVNLALSRVKSSAMVDMSKYEKWQEQFGVE